MLLSLFSLFLSSARKETKKAKTIGPGLGWHPLPSHFRSLALARPPSRQFSVIKIDTIYLCLTGFLPPGMRTERLSQSCFGTHLGYFGPKKAV